MKLSRQTIMASLPVVAAGALCTTGVAFGQAGDAGTSGGKAVTELLTSRPVLHPGAQGGVAGPNPCEYLHDDGMSENAVGLVAGGNITWANAYTTLGGCENIGTVRVAFGAMAVAGSPAKVFVYDDPDNDGNPDDAVLLAITDVTTANEDTDIFNDYPIGPVVVNGIFFVGASVDHAAGDFPASVDQSSPSAMSSWLSLNPTDPNDPLPTGNPALSDTIPAPNPGDIGGNYLVRAVADTGPDNCPEDSNNDGLVNVDDLVNLITQWGCPNPPCSADNNDDGLVNVDDLVNLITAWGACPIENDTCDTAKVVFGGVGELFQGVLTCEPQSTLFDNTAAASDGAALTCDGTAMHHDLWFRYTATCNGELHIDTNGSAFDTVVELWSGCPGAGGAVTACDNDSGTDGQDSALVVLVNQGQQIWIRVGGSDFGGSTGSGQLNICCAESIPDPPSNDDCANAEPLAIGGTDAEQTISASPDPEIEGMHCPAGIPGQANGVWYSVTGNGQTLTVSLCDAGTDYDSVINVLCGPCGSLQCIGGDDDGCGEVGGPSSFSWCSANGQQYLIFVQGFAGATGNFVISLTSSGVACTPAAPCTPFESAANDACADAIPITNGVTPYENLTATTDGPAHTECALAGDGGNTTEDIWFTYVADCGLNPGELGFLRVSTCEELGGSADHDSDLVIYDPSLVKGPVCDNLAGAFLDCNDDDPANACGAAPNFHSTLEVPVIQGNTYLIRLGSWNTGNAGTGNLLVECGPADDDLCVFATVMDAAPGVPVNYQVDLCTATVDAFAPICTSAAPSQPGRWVVIPGSGTNHRISLCNANDPQGPGSVLTRLMVYCGPCDELECVAGEPTNNGACPGTERLDWHTEVGRDYYALVHLETSTPCTGAGMNAIVDINVTDLNIVSTMPPCQACLDECLPGDIAEGEPCYSDGAMPDAFNAGCNNAGDPTHWSSVSPGQTICGSTSTYTNSAGAAVRDTDWYLFTPTVTGSYSWTGIAEYNIHLIVATVGGNPPTMPDCGALGVIEGQFGLGGCTPTVITQTLTAGQDYLMYVSLQTAAAGGANNPCTGDSTPNVYRVTLTGPN